MCLFVYMNSWPLDRSADWPPAMAASRPASGPAGWPAGRPTDQATISTPMAQGQWQVVCGQVGAHTMFNEMGSLGGRSWAWVRNSSSAQS